MGAEIRSTSRYASAAARLDELCAFSGSEKGFWSLCLGILAEVAGARLAALYRAEEGEAGWECVLAIPGEAVASPEGKKLLASLAEVAAAAAKNGVARIRPRDGGWLLAIRLQESDSASHASVFLIDEAPEAVAEETLGRLRLLTHLPAMYRSRQDVSRSEIAVGHFAAVLDLATLVNSQRRFLATAMTLCNELASRHQCDRVSLGWLKGDYVRLKAISHSEKFEKRMEAVQLLEAAMEESLDQDEIVIWPEPVEQRLITRDHAQFAEAQDAKHVCSLPLRVDGEPIAVLTCERNSAPFAEVETRLLNLCGEVAIRRLADLERDDCWFGKRWARSVRERSARLLGPRHTMAKLAALVVLGLLLWLVFGRITYRVDAPFSLRTEQTALVASPINSYLDEVKVEVGAEVKKGDVLAVLDTRELIVEEGGALADQDRFVREIQKAKAAEKLADMRIAEAQAEQARAHLELVRFRRNQATIVAPFDGVVVEGDLKKRIGAPVRQGDVLFRIARTDQFYIECLVAEADVPELKAGGVGEIAFASQPKLKFPIRIRQIDPATQPKENTNVVVARCVIEAPPADWWRPGMSGVAQLEVGRRSPGWALTRRTADYLRLHYWW